MKVLLKNDVLNLGYAGEVIDVADGYGRNYLIPKGLAVKATSGVLSEADAWRERAAVRVEEIRHENEALSKRINATSLTFYARAGDTGKLYGSVTTGDVADKLNEELGTDVDRRIISSGPLRQLGEHKVTIKLGRDFHPQVTVNIHPLEPEEAAEEVEEGEETSDVSAEASAEETETGETAPESYVSDEEEMAVDESEIVEESIESSDESLDQEEPDSEEEASEEEPD